MDETVGIQYQYKMQLQSLPRDDSLGRLFFLLHRTPTLIRKICLPLIQHPQICYPQLLLQQFNHHYCHYHTLSLHNRHKAELAAAASQPLPDDDDDAFD